MKNKVKAIKSNENHGNSRKREDKPLQAMNNESKQRTAMNTCKYKAKQGKTIKHMNKPVNK